MRLTVGSATDVGQLRSLNEDSVLVVEDLYAVADGMGGHRGGEVASARALVAFEQATNDHTLESLMRAVRTANHDVLEHARTSPDLTGMGTTLCALARLDDRRVGVVNVGDSRVYVLRGGDLFQVSEDHSFVESLVRDGRLTRAQAEVHPQRNVLTRALGIEPQIDVDGWEVVVRNGDRFLLCSDGLFNEVPDDLIQASMRAIVDPVELCGVLVAAANEGGGRDNISCVVVDVSEVVDDPDEFDDAMPVGRPIDSSLTRRSSAADLDETSLDDATVEPVAPASTGAVPSVLSAPTGAMAPSEPPRRRRIGWRTVVFVLAILLTFGVALGATDWYYKNTYSVAADGQRVAIYRGPRDTAILWFHPSILDSDNGPALDDLTDAQRKAVIAGVDGLSLAEARRYVDSITPPPATTTTSTTTTTTATTTTVVPATTTPAAPA